MTQLTSTRRFPANGPRPVHVNEFRYTAATGNGRSGGPGSGGQRKYRNEVPRDTDTGGILLTRGTREKTTRDDGGLSANSSGDEKEGWEGDRERGGGGNVNPVCVWRESVNGKRTRIAFGRYRVHRAREAVAPQQLGLARVASRNND